MQYLRNVITSICLCLVTFISNGKAQSHSSLIPKEEYFEAFAGYSPYSIRFLGKTPGGQSTFVNFAYGRQIKLLGNGSTLFYKVTAVPYLHYNYPKRDDGNRKDVATGFGISPIGFGLVKYMKPTSGYMLTTSGGIVYVNKFFPTDKAHRLNFTFDLSVAYLQKINNNFNFSMGYKFHHISNARTGQENPGLDSNFIFISLLFFK